MSSVVICNKNGNGNGNKNVISTIENNNKNFIFFLQKFLMDDLDPLNPICQHLQKKKKCSSSKIFCLHKMSVEARVILNKAKGFFYFKIEKNPYKHSGFVCVFVEGFFVLTAKIVMPI